MNDIQKKEVFEAVLTRLSFWGLSAKDLIEYAQEKQKSLEETNEKEVVEEKETKDTSERQKPLEGLKNPQQNKSKK